MNHHRSSAHPLLFALPLLLLAACTDLNVPNLNAPDREDVLASFEDGNALIADSFNRWFNGVFSYYGPGLFLSQASFQHSLNAACRGVYYSHIPRIAFQNDEDHVYYGNITRIWFSTYQAITAANDGLRGVLNPSLNEQAAPEQLAAAEAFGRFSLGMAHGTLALLYDQGFRVDETTDPLEEQNPLAYMELMDAALAYFDQAIALASTSSFTLPFGWMSAAVSAPHLVRISHSMKARFRAQVARTAAERQAVNWPAVIADVDAGIQDDFDIYMDWNNGWYNTVLDYSVWMSWSQLPYFIYGMADQSGDYLAWAEQPLSEKTAWFENGEPVLIVTPDQRFPRGETVDQQRKAPGAYFSIVSEESEGDTWRYPMRGRWRWSWYKPGPRGTDYGRGGNFTQPLIRLEEMRLLKAEALYRMGNRAGAAQIINESRVRAGLSATDASGSNASCVPRLPDGSCGDLWEMLKWEKRMETVWTGVAGANWWLDGRGWNDLWEDSPLQIPMPCSEMKILGMTPCHTYGGPGGAMSAPGSSYAFEQTGLFGAGGPQGVSEVELPPLQAYNCDAPMSRH